MVGLRNRAFDHRLLRTEHVDVPVISIGNISVGGTGKTPLVEHLAAHLLGIGRRPAVVTRGYRRATKGNFIVSDGRGHVASARQGGDEAVQIAQKLPGLVVIADEKRIRGCRLAAEQFSADIILLDDAFQHRNMHRDVDIVVVDATENLDSREMLPAGRLREPLASLRRADAIVLSKCRPATPVAAMKKTLVTYSDAPVFAARFVPRRIRRLGAKESLPLETLRGLPLGGFCGIGRPEGFRRTLDELQANIVTMRDYPDHHWYTAADITELQRQGGDAGALGWITTEKDAVRLRDDNAWKSLGEVYYPEMEVEFVGDSVGLFILLANASARGAHVR
ncbi:MAG: tetraacyldisaccharide 4'-kinase [Bacteroidetes bacterium]|nr:tetraacyldisaccharide 4'-kinase [Bacteroidota bacterium]